jgi:hypothetical protein
MKAHARIALVVLPLLGLAGCDDPATHNQLSRVQEQLNGLQSQIANVSSQIGNLDGLRTLVITIAVIGGVLVLLTLAGLAWTVAKVREMEVRLVGLQFIINHSELHGLGPVRSVKIVSGSDHRDLPAVRSER